MAVANPKPAPKYDVVDIPRAALMTAWFLPFDDLWAAAAEGNADGFVRMPKTTEIDCEADRALLRRGADGKPYLLRQN